MRKLILTAVDEKLARAWEGFCGELEFVDVHRGSILDLEVDAVVSPANSFGFMDGGIDAIYVRHFGARVQSDVQRVIRERHHGELLVGQADVVATGSATIPWMIIAPTMRVPMKLVDSVNPYLAARVVFLMMRHGRFVDGAFEGEPIADHIQSVAMPGLGTGVGGVGAATSAHQVRAAIDDVLFQRSTPPRTWAEASERHQLLYTDRPRRLQ